MGWRVGPFGPEIDGNGVLSRRWGQPELIVMMKHRNLDVKRMRFAPSLEDRFNELGE